MGGESRYQTNIPSKQIIIPTRDFVLIKKQQQMLKHNNKNMSRPEFLFGFTWTAFGLWSKGLFQ